MASQPSWWQKHPRVLPGQRLEAVQGGAGFEGLQNLFFRCPCSIRSKRCEDPSCTSGIDTGPGSPFLGPGTPIVEPIWSGNLECSGRMGDTRGNTLSMTICPPKIRNPTRTEDAPLEAVSENAQIAPSHGSDNLAARKRFGTGQPSRSDTRNKSSNSTKKGQQRSVSMKSMIDDSPPITMKRPPCTALAACCQRGGSPAGDRPVALLRPTFKWTSWAPTGTIGKTIVVAAGRT